MLVLSSRSGEEILAGSIRFKVLRVHGNQAKLGIEAPDSVRILRGDVVDENTPPDFEAAAEHVVALCNEAFADVGSMPPLIAELYRAAVNVVGSGLVEHVEEPTLKLLSHAA